jgi:hypothetical protein
MSLNRGLHSRPSGSTANRWALAKEEISISTSRKDLSTAYSFPTKYVECHRKGLGYKSRESQ